MLAAETERPAFLIHSLDVAFGRGWLNSEISRAGIQRRDTGSVQLSTTEQKTMEVSNETGPLLCRGASDLVFSQEAKQVPAVVRTP